MFRKIENQRPFQGILDQITENVRAGKLKLGEALPAERMMAEQLGVSRPVVREALRALELLGIITSVRGGANYISAGLEHCLIHPFTILFSMNNSSVTHAQQLRAALEQKAAYLAAQNCDKVEAVKLQMILAQMEVETDETRRGDLDRDLHMSIARMAQNPMIYSALSAASELTENIITGIRSYLMQKNGEITDIEEQHHLLVKAIVSGDSQEAERCMHEHMMTIERYIEEKCKDS